MKILSFDEYVKINEGIPGDIAKRDLHGRTRKEDIIADKDELIERIQEEFEKQNSKTTHELDLTMLDVSLVEDMSELFNSERDVNDKYPYERLKSIDVSNWNINNVKYMIYMFSNCSSLKSIDVSNWDVSNVKYIPYMFSNCSSLESIDVSKWDVDNVKDMSFMFNGCKFDYKKEGNRLIKLSKITEGILGDIARRDLSGGRKKEDSITDYDKHMIDYLLKTFAHEIVYYSSYVNTYSELYNYINTITSGDIDGDFGPEIYDYLDNITDGLRKKLCDYISDNYSTKIKPVLDEYIQHEEEERSYAED